MERLFVAILNMSISSSIVIAAVMAVRLLIKRLPRKFSYFLWGIVLIRLLCPILPTAEFGLTSEGKLIKMQGELAETEESSLPEEMNTESIVVSTLENQEVHYSDVQKMQTPSVASQVREKDNAEKASVLSMGKSSENVLRIATCIWLAGMLLLISYGIGSYVALKSKYRTLCQKGDTIVISDKVESPFTAGLLHPIIFVPAGLWREQQSLVIAHEKVHIRRKDPLVKALFFLALSIHWFHPLVWFAFYLMEQDMEVSCDEAVLKNQGTEQKKMYAKTLLLFAHSSGMIKSCPIAFGESSIKTRIKNAVKLKKATPPAIAVGTIVVILAAGILLVNRTDRTEQADDTASVLEVLKEEQPGEEDIKEPRAVEETVALSLEDEQKGVQVTEETAVPPLEDEQKEMQVEEKELLVEEKKKAEAMLLEEKQELEEAKKQAIKEAQEQAEAYQQAIEKELEKQENETKENIMQEKKEQEEKQEKIEQDEIKLVEYTEKSTDSYEGILRNKEGIYNEFGIFYQSPVPGAEISDTYEIRVHPITGEERFHSGIDFAAEKGTAVLAAAEGTVYETGFDAVAGNYVILAHGNGEMTYYANCDTILTETGKAVKAGEQIATVGSTGVATGAHLHFALSYRGSFIEPVIKEKK